MSEVTQLSGFTSEATATHAIRTLLASVQAIAEHTFANPAHASG